MNLLMIVIVCTTHREEVRMISSLLALDTPVNVNNNIQFSDYFYDCATIALVCQKLKVLPSKILCTRHVDVE